MPRDRRIRRGSEIRALLDGGERKRTRSLDVFVASSPAAWSRLGLVVPKHGQRIVSRNKVKRRLREIGRRSLLPELDRAGASVDVLVRARRGAYEAEFGVLEAEFKGAVAELCSRKS